MLTIFGLIVTLFWLWILEDCARHEPNRLWVAIVLLFYFPGAMLYLLNLALTERSRKIISPVRRLQLQQELRSAKIAVRSIGKDYQYLMLGNVLLELGDLDRAERAYGRALVKAPKHPYALYGAASVAYQQGRCAVAARHLELLLKIDRDHLQGDASLMYAQVLFNLEKRSIAKSHLIHDIERWGHPESIVMLAKIEIQQSNLDRAKQLLQQLLIDLKKSPQYHLNRHQTSLRQARLLLSTLP